MLYIYKDRRLIFLCMLFFFIQINPNENESSCLISEWNFLWRGGILLQSGWILIYFQISCFLSEVKFLSNVYMVYEIHISNLIFSLYQYTRVLADRCVGGLAPNCHWKKLAFDFGYMKKKNIPPNLRSMIYLQELTQLVRRKSKLEFNKKPLEEGGGNGCFLVGVRIFPTPLLKNKGCWAVVPFAVALHHQRHHVSLSLEHLWHGGNAGASWF